MKITVYHGATEIVKAPLCKIGRPRLDFGQGFYVTDLKEQAIDRVIDTVNLYITGFYDTESALQQLAFHKPNNQICILNQELLNKYLEYDGTKEI